MYKDPYTQYAELLQHQSNTIGHLVMWVVLVPFRIAWLLAKLLFCAAQMLIRKIRGSEVVTATTAYIYPQSE